MSDTTLLYLIFALMLLVALGAVIPSLMKTQQERCATASDSHREALSEALRDELSKLEEDRASARLTEPLYLSLREDLERRALEEHRAMSCEKTIPLKVSVGALVLVISLGMTLLSGGIYAVVGAPDLLRLTKEQAVFQGTATLKSLEDYLVTNKNDGRAWILLARKYIDEEKYRQAANAYREGMRASAKISADPVVMMECAAILLTIGDSTSFEEAKTLLIDAQQKVPQDLKASELLAIASIATGDWTLAVRELRILMQNTSPDTPQYMRLEGMLREAESRLGTQTK